MRNACLFVLAAGLSAGLSACGDTAKVPAQEGFGPNPTLPDPDPRFIPTVNVAPARHWAAGAKPVAAPGLTVSAFATDLAHPRWLHVLPNGDVLVAESDAPPKPEDAKGPRGWIMKWLMRRAGSNTPSADRITLLRDADGDGRPESRSVLLEGLHSPFGIALVGGTLYVANTDALIAVPYQSGQTRIDASPREVTDLPAGPINHHWTKDVIASPDGSKLYVTVGSNSNAAENGLDVEARRAAILEVDPATGGTRVYASGLRNPNGLSWNPDTGALWVAVNERDEIGSDLVPDYMTSVQDGGFYGWPFSYYGHHVDERVKPPRPDLVARAIVPDYALGAHTASLGLTFAKGGAFPEPFADGAFVSQHGSWNRKPASGYKVIFVPFTDGRPDGPPRDVLTGFLDSEGNAQGRPVGIAIDRTGALLVADDVGNTVWRVTAEAKASQAGSP
jgi:glucose/arabinose dehydrogenase